MSITQFFSKYRRAVAISGAIVSLLISIIYLYIVPDEAAQASGLERIVLLYGHPAVWLLIGFAMIASLCKAKKLMHIALYVALGVYILFFAMLIL